MTQVNSTMREAFDNILLKNIKRHCTRTVKIISDGLNRKVGLIRSDTWHANISNHTAAKLNARSGFNFDRQPKMAYDDMVSGKE